MTTTTPHKETSPMTEQTTTQPEAIDYPAPIVVKQHSRGVLFTAIAALLVSLTFTFLTLVLLSRPNGVCVEYSPAFPGSDVNVVTSVTVPSIQGGVASCDSGSYLPTRPHRVS